MSVYAIVCSLPEVQSPSITIYSISFTFFILPPPLFPSGNPNSVVCTYE